MGRRRVYRRVKVWRREEGRGYTGGEGREGEVWIKG